MPTDHREKAAGGMSKRVVDDRGRFKVFEPTREQRQLVGQLAAFGIPRASICKAVQWPNGASIDEKTMRKHFADDLEHGKAMMVAKVAQALFKSALGGNLGAQIFFLKARGGWKETVTVENTGKDGARLPAPAQITVYLPQKDQLDAASAQSRTSPAPITVRSREGQYAPAEGDEASCFELPSPPASVQPTPVAHGNWSDGSGFYPSSADPRGA